MEGAGEDWEVRLIKHTISCNILYDKRGQSMVMFGFKDPLRDEKI